MPRGGSILAADVGRIVGLCGRLRGGAHLIGHSYGAAVAPHVALAAPRRIRSVTVYEPVLFRLLRDCYGRGRPGAEIWDLAQSVRADFRAGANAAAAHRFIDYWSGAGTWDALPPSRQMGHAARIPVIDAHFAALLNDTVSLDALRSLQVPVLCIAGRSTRAPVTRIAELLVGALPHAVLERVPGLGHIGPVTHPLAFAERALEFVRRVHAFDPETLRAA